MISLNLSKKISVLATGFMIMSSPALANLPAVGFADLVEAKAPAVVVIKAEQTMVRRPNSVVPLPPFMQGNPGIPPEIMEQFEEFMQRALPSVPGGVPEQPTAGIGAGFLISEDGYIVTNHHVIDKADKITVEFSNGDTIEAELIGSDPKTDLAVLDISGNDYPYLRFGDSKVMRVGDVVIAIGAPFGLSGSVSAGIVSAIGREIGNGPYDDFIQTDAAINKGNSGGPLMNVEGDVIGVNTAIFSNSGGSIGIGFAIPAVLAEKVVNDLLAKGIVERGWLGVQIQPITEQIAEAFSIEAKAGILVGDVFEDSPASLAGLSIGDIITVFNGNKIEKMSDLPRFVADTPIGSEVPVEIIRGQDTLIIDVKIGKMEEESNPVSTVSDSSYPALKEFGVRLSDSEQSIVVVSVSEDSRAAAYGLEVGDVITRFGSDTEFTMQDLEDSLQMGRVSIIQVRKPDGRLEFIAFK